MCQPQTYYMLGRLDRHGAVPAPSSATCSPWQHKCNIASKFPCRQHVSMMSAEVHHVRQDDTLQLAHSSHITTSLMSASF